ncbi:MAG: Cof-type HAD-IIB family hydrolase [Tepidanaerobacteraceae bacterium]|jgi:Cof subfamily protein (haloacid dehalogenase superfamily)|nr:Cof-type HAD-IIB family hydrolase [Tepidanaerobacteraceae bacterium]
MYHMLVTDIDGTLLDGEGKVPEETKKILAILREKRGFITTIATGRMLARAETIAREIMINAPLICYNGALIIDIYTRHRILERPIPAGKLVKLIEILKAGGYEAIIYENETLKIEKFNERTQWYINECENIEYNVVDDLMDYVKRKNLNSYKVFAVGDLYGTVGVPEELLFALDKDFEVSLSDSSHMEINLKGVNKGSAVKFLADALKIDSTEIITIGDGHNDISMLKYAGLGIAMGNAAEHIKDHAKYITLSNCENGLLDIVNKFIVPQEKISLED